ncbi:ferritin-like superfamily [Boletus coccyginus]|nr:ferritin-like superfamily [Boletus coccyginus]
MAAILTPFQVSSLPTPRYRGNHCLLIRLLSKPPSSKESLLDDKKCSISPDSLIDDPSSEKDKFKVFHAKFIDEVDLPKYKYSPPCEELLLKVSRHWFVLFPIQYHKIWQMYKKAEMSFWTEEEMDLSKDLYHRNTHLNNNERQFISHVLAFFAASNGIVNKNLVRRFSNEVQAAEACCFYDFQIMMENIHSEIYSLLIDSYIKDPMQYKYLFNAMDAIPCIKHKADWALKWILDQCSIFAACLVAFTTVEGIPFLGIHTNFTCLLFSHLKQYPHSDIIWQIITGAIKIEQEFLAGNIFENTICYIELYS